MYTIEQAGSAEQTLQKSRFIASASQITSEQHALQFLRVIATQHVSAHHLAFANRVKTLKAIVPRFSDAGEPSGTAGKPILQMLEGRELINVCGRNTLLWRRQPWHRRISARLQRHGKISIKSSFDNAFH